MPWHSSVPCLSFPSCRRGRWEVQVAMCLAQGEDKGRASPDSRFIFQFKIQSGFAPMARAGSCDE